MIDPALLRSGRIDRRIEIPIPGVADLTEVYAFYLPGQFGHEELTTFARASIGKTGGRLCDDRSSGQGYRTAGTAAAGER